MGKPKKELSSGKVRMTVWENDFDGKPSYSVTLKKNYMDQQTKEWKQSDFFSQTDLKDVLILVQSSVLKGIKTRDIQTRNNPETQQPPIVNKVADQSNTQVIDPFQPDDMPF